MGHKNLKSLSHIYFAVLAVFPVSVSGNEEQRCLADEASTRMHEASSQVSIATADQIYGLRNKDGSDGEGWNAPDMAACVGGLDLGVGLGLDLPGLDDGAGSGSSGGSGAGAGTNAGAACALVNRAISSGIDRWGAFAADSERLGELKVGVAADLQNVATRLDDYVQRINEKRDEYE